MPSPGLTDSPLSADQLGSQWWRLNNLYWIITDAGDRVRFVPNAVQSAFYRAMWYLNIILKSRQHGFTTLIDILALDCALFNANFTAGIIAHGLAEAQGIFQTKVKFTYDNLPEWLRERIYPTTDSAKELVLSNGSRVMVGTSMRSGTLQFLHVSEFGKISRRYPEKAKEIVTGAFNTVRAGQFMFVESTAEGRDGYYYKMVGQAEKIAQLGHELTAMDFRLHFYGWQQDTRNRLKAVVPITQENRDYFERLAVEHGIKLDAEQKAWYVKKKETQGDEMKREHPSTPAEAFESAGEGYFYGKQMALLRARKRITKVDHIPSEPTNTFWDLGRNHLNAIWFHQFVAGEHRFFDYYENHGEDLAHYVGMLQKRGYVYGRHFLPHDAENKNLERNESRVDRLVQLHISFDSIVVVPRCEHLGDAIEYTRKILPLCWFDEERAAQGIKCLDNYQQSWDETAGVWRPEPKKDDFVNGADAFRQFAQGWTPAAGGTFKRREHRSARTV